MKIRQTVKKKMHQLLNIIMGSSIGLLTGSGFYQYRHFRKYPDLYVMQSAPWYTSVLVQGFFTLTVLAVCIILKVILTENTGRMKKAVLILGIIFLFLTCTGVGYVLINHGQVNAGYAVIPGIWTMICFGYCRSK